MRSRTHGTTRRELSSGFLSLILSSSSFSQVLRQPLSFEAATVKRVNLDDSAPTPFASAFAGMASMTGGPGTEDPERISYTNTNLKLVLLKAYQLERFQISGPDWINTDRFDIVAKVPRDATEKQFQEMLQTLLVERFRLRAHQETRELPQYVLITQTGGHKMRPSETHGEPSLKYIIPDLTKPHAQPYATQIVCQNMTMPDFAMRLSGRLAADYLDRQVVDATGLAGAFDFHLQWTNSSVIANSNGVTIFEALTHQLGLKLESRKGPVQILVIDGISRNPIEN